MKRFLIIPVFLILSIGVFSQNTPDAFSNRINYIFQNVNKSIIPTGILQEYGIDFTNINNYNGLVLNDSNKVVLSEWRSLYNSLYSSQINPIANLSLFSSIEDKLDTATSNSLLIMHYNFNSLRTDAITNNLMSIYNDQIFDVPSRPASPYNTESVFAICVNDAWFDNEYVSFVFKQDLFFTNTGKTVSALYLDGGNGYQIVNWNLPAAFTFNTIGIHTIKAKIVYSDATSFESHFNIHVKNIGDLMLKSQEIITPQNFIADPDVAITSARTFSGPAAAGRIQIRRNSQNGGVIRKPLIIAEGFDPSLIQKTENMDITSFISTMNEQAGITLKQDLDLAGYDLIYLDYTNGTDYIQNNAYLLQDVIKWVNLNKAYNAEQTVMLGMSMGALTAQWALKDMEDRNEPHNVRLNISFDGPHNGAYVPLSAIAFVNGIHDFKFSLGLVGIPLITLFDASAVQPMYNLLNSPAAKQMLVYNLNFDEFSQSFNDNNTTYTTFMNDYHTKGKPTTCTNIAISNGSSCGTAQSIPPGAFYVNINESKTLNWLEKAALFYISPYTLLTNKPKFAISGLLGILPNKTSLSAQVKLGALSTYQNTEIYKTQIGIKRKIFGIINVNTYLVNNSYFSGSKLPIDASPGGTYSISNFSSGLPSNLGGYIQYNSFCFVPTVSALDMATNLYQYNPGHLNYAYQEMGRSSFPKSTPFSKINVGFQGNEGHISFQNKNSRWLFAEMQGIASSECYAACPTYVAIGINGIPSVCTSASYSIINLPQASSVVWSISNPSVATLSSNGNSVNVTRITGSGNTLVNLTATITTPCGVTSKTRSITMGTERPVITGMPNGFTFTLGVSRTLTVTNSYPVGTIYIWGKEGQVQIMSGLGTNEIVLSALTHGAPSPNTFSVYCAVVTPDCTSSPTSTSLFGKVIYPSGMMIAYPNPASNELTISREQQLTDSFESFQPIKTTAVLFTYKLFNEKGNILKSGNGNFNGDRTKIDTSDIPNGTYYLHIIEGKEITKKQIIISH